MSTKSSPRWLRFAGTCPRRIQYRNLSGVTCIRRAAVFTETRLSARCSLSGPSTNFDSRRRISVSAIKNGTASSCAAISPARDSTHRHHAAALFPSGRPGSRSLRRCRHHSRSRISTKSVVSVTHRCPASSAQKSAASSARAQPSTASSSYPQRHSTVDAHHARPTQSPHPSHRLKTLVFLPSFAPNT